jgi:hypothetical protein
VGRAREARDEGGDGGRVKMQVRRGRIRENNDVTGPRDRVASFVACRACHPPFAPLPHHRILLSHHSSLCHRGLAAPVHAYPQPAGAPTTTTRPPMRRASASASHRRPPCPPPAWRRRMTAEVRSSCICAPLTPLTCPLRVFARYILQHRTSGAPV